MKRVVSCLGDGSRLDTADTAVPADLLAILTHTCHGFPFEADVEVMSWNVHYLPFPDIVYSLFSWSHLIRWYFAVKTASLNYFTIIISGNPLQSGIYWLVCMPFLIYVNTSFIFSKFLQRQSREVLRWICEELSSVGIIVSVFIEVRRNCIFTKLLTFCLLCAGKIFSQKVVICFPQKVLFIQICVS
jgi:hypothetical protein